MDYYVDTASFVYPTANWANVAPFEPKRREQKTLMGWTEFTTATASAIDFFRTVTGPLAPTAAPSTQAEPVAGMTAPLSERSVTPIAAAVVVVPLSADVERIAKQRVQLMAAKYAGGIESSEIMARLEILNYRLLDLAPRVSKEQVVALEDAQVQLVRIRAAREERSKRLGIPA